MAELTVAPIVLFTLAVRYLGMDVAVLVPAAWACFGIARRLVFGRTIPGLLALGALTAVSKASFAVLTGNVALYLLQPTLSSALIGTAFALSIPLGRPLAHRIVRDITGCDVTEGDAGHDRARFLVRATALWAGVKLTNATIGLVLFYWTSPTSYVAARTACCWTVTAIGAALIAAAWQRTRHGTTTITELPPRRSLVAGPPALCPVAA